jgi:hypothetical protein
MRLNPRPSTDKSLIGGKAGLKKILVGFGRAILYCTKEQNERRAPRANPILPRVPLAAIRPSPFVIRHSASDHPPNEGIMSPKIALGDKTLGDRTSPRVRLGTSYSCSYPYSYSESNWSRPGANSMTMTSARTTTSSEYRTRNPIRIRNRPFPSPLQIQNPTAPQKNQGAHLSNMSAMSALSALSVLRELRPLLPFLNPKSQIQNFPPSRR